MGVQDCKSAVSESSEYVCTCYNYCVMILRKNKLHIHVVTFKLILDIKCLKNTWRDDGSSSFFLMVRSSFGIFIYDKENRR